MNIGKVYKAEKIIESSVIDAEYALKITEITRMAQDAASNQCYFCKSSIPDLMKKNLTWVIVKQHYEIEKYPAWLDKIEVSTWSKGKKGFFWFRDILFSKTGSLKNPCDLAIENAERENDLAQMSETSCEKKSLIRALTNWMILDLETGRPLREDSGFPIENNTVEDSIIDVDFSKIKTPEKFDCEVEVSPDFQDIDMNGHVNNNHYIRYFLSSIPATVRKNRRIAILDTYFISSAHIGDTISCKTAIVTDSDNSATSGASINENISCVSILYNKETGVEFFRAKTIWKDEKELIDSSWLE